MSGVQQARYTNGVGACDVRGAISIYIQDYAFSHLALVVLWVFIEQAASGTEQNCDVGAVRKQTEEGGIHLAVAIEVSGDDVSGQQVCWVSVGGGGVRSLCLIQVHPKVDEICGYGARIERVQNVVQPISVHIGGDQVV